MFTGIIENIGKVVDIKQNNGNYHIVLSTSFLSSLKIGDSISHDGICCTVSDITSDTYQVTAIQETIQRTNIKYWKIHDKINLEQCMPVQGRLNGHIVQGHIDQVGKCIAIQKNGDSWQYTFTYINKDHVLVEKGSIAINGVSLTCFNVKENHFDVAIIPHTYYQTNFQYLKINTFVNLEFDIIGKYIHQYIKNYYPKNI